MRLFKARGSFAFHTGALAPDPEAGRASPPCTPRYVLVRGQVEGVGAHHADLGLDFVIEWCQSQLVNGCG